MTPIEAPALSRKASSLVTERLRVRSESVCLEVLPLPAGAGHRRPEHDGR